MTSRSVGGGRRLQMVGLLVVLASFLVLPAVARITELRRCLPSRARSSSVGSGRSRRDPTSPSLSAGRRRTSGSIQAFLNAQTTIVAVKGGAPIDLSAGYAPIASTSGGSYFTRVAHDTGITLGAGEQLTFELVISFSHRVLDGFTLADETSHRPLFFGPGAAFEFRCVVTGT